MLQKNTRVDPEIEEGGRTYSVGVVRCAQDAVVCKHIAQHSKGVLGHAPSGKFRQYESTSEAVGDHHNNTTFMPTRV